MKIYAYSGCSTCRSALKLLKTLHVEHEILPILDQPPSTSELRKMLSLVDGRIRKLFNSSGAAYREQKLGERLSSMKDDEAIELLASDGRLVKRPFAIGRGFGLVGYSEGEWRKALSGFGLVGRDI